MFRGSSMFFRILTTCIFQSFVLCMGETDQNPLTNALNTNNAFEKLLDPEEQAALNKYCPKSYGACNTKVTQSTSSVKVDGKESKKSDRKATVYSEDGPVTVEKKTTYEKVPGEGPIENEVIGVKTPDGVKHKVE